MLTYKVLVTCQPTKDLLYVTVYCSPKIWLSWLL